uniref:Uncharacterized protein n=1 Tax=Sphingobacterium sp. (strain 21) TaxID=743722 RepID=F4CBR1_SPHS2
MIVGAVIWGIGIFAFALDLAPPNAAYIYSNYRNNKTSKS